MRRRTKKYICAIREDPRREDVGAYSHDVRQVNDIVFTRPIGHSR